MPWEAAVSDEGSSRSGPDEAIKRQNAELLQADVADLVLFLVGTVLSEFTLASVVHDTIMAWATEAVEAGQRKERRADSEATPVSNLKRLVELGRQDAQVWAALDNATLMVGDAAWRLATIRPDDRAGQAQARRVLGAAIKELIAASDRLMRLDAEARAARVSEGRQQRMRQPRRNMVIKRPGIISAGPNDPFGRRRPGRRAPSPRLLPGQRFQYDVGPSQEPKRQIGSTASRPAPNHGRRAPGAR